MKTIRLTKKNHSPPEVNIIFSGRDLSYFGNGDAYNIPLNEDEARTLGMMLIDMANNDIQETSLTIGKEQQD
jgi:hypothetical protein